MYLHSLKVGCPQTIDTVSHIHNHHNMMGNTVRMYSGADVYHSSSSEEGVTVYRGQQQDDGELTGW